MWKKIRDSWPIVQLVGWTVSGANFSLNLLLHYAAVAAFLAGGGAVVSYLYSPHLTGALTAGVLTFFATLGIAREIRWARISPGEIPGGPMQAVPVAKASEKQSTVSVDFVTLDKIDQLKLYEAAALWSEREPANANTLDPTVHPRFVMLQRAVNGGKLTLENPQPVNVALHLASDVSGEVPGNTLVSRASLRTFAERLNERPKFLFPEDRVRVAFLSPKPEDAHKVVIPELPARLYTKGDKERLGEILHELSRELDAGARDAGDAAVNLSRTFFHQTDEMRNGRPATKFNEAELKARYDDLWKTTEALIERLEWYRNDPRELKGYSNELIYVLQSRQRYQELRELLRTIKAFEDTVTLMAQAADTAPNDAKALAVRVTDATRSEMHKAGQTFRAWTNGCQSRIEAVRARLIA